MIFTQVAILAAFAAAAAAAPLPLLAAPKPPPLVSEQARPADAFVESVGTGTRFDWLIEGGNLPGIKRALKETGIRYARVGVQPEIKGPHEPYYAALDEIARDLGTRYCVSTWYDGREAIVRGLDRIGRNAYAVEGVNESFRAPGTHPNGWTNSLEVQKFLFAEGKKRGLDVYSWTLGGQAQWYLDMPDADAYCTHGNIHPYHWYGNVDQPWSAQKASASLFHSWKQTGDGKDAKYTFVPGFVGAIRTKMVRPTKPLVATEYGWNSGKAAGDFTVSDEAKRRYVPRAMLEMFNAGLVRAYQYNLIEYFDRDYGLAQKDGTLKPAGVAVKNLLALAGDRGPSFTPGRLTYALDVPSGMKTTDDRDPRNTEIHHTLLQKRDGRFLLVLWVDGDSHKAAVPDQAVTLRLAKPARSVRTFRPLFGSVPAATFAKTALVTLSVPDHPLVVEIRP